jgi:hypothetical protein
MIPLIAIVKIKNNGALWGWNLWIPLFLIWILLLPFVLLALPFFFLACLIGLLNPFKALGILGEILSSFRGTLIEVHEQTHSVFIQIL